MHIPSNCFFVVQRLYFFCCRLVLNFKRIFLGSFGTQHESSFIKAAAIKCNGRICVARKLNTYSVNKFCNFITHPFAMVCNNHQLQAAGIRSFWLSYSVCERFCVCMKKMWCQIILMHLILRVIYWHLIVHKTNSILCISFCWLQQKKIAHEKCTYLHFINVIISFLSRDKNNSEASGCQNNRQTKGFRIRLHLLGNGRGER